MEGLGMIDSMFWQGKRVLITGHTGFKGSWLSIWLQSMGAQVEGVALEPPTSPNLFSEARVADGMVSRIIDIRQGNHLKLAFQDIQPEIVIHMAAQPLVRYSYDHPVETYETNVMGTLHVLEAVRSIESVKVVLNVTTDKCYENREWVWGYRETDPMGGYDPYSSSKGCSELLTAAYRRSFFDQKGVAVASARAGNVIGGGDWAENRLVPDMLKAFERDEPVIIRNPDSIRPWQHVLEPLSGYLLLIQRLWENPESFKGGWNFGPHDEDAKPVDWIVDRMVAKWGDRASWHLDQKPNPHEANYLKLDISKSCQALGWKPRWSLDVALDLIISWHKRWLAGEDARKLCESQIDLFVSGVSGLGSTNYQELSLS